MDAKGLCGEHTPYKQKVVSKFFEHHIDIVRQIYEKHGQWNPYLYFDLFAGPGYLICDNYEGPGSPLQFHRLMSLEDYEYKMTVAELDDDRRFALSDILSNANAPFTLKDNALRCCPEIIRKWHYGLVYIDLPMTLESFEIIKKIIPDFIKYCPQVDIVLYLGAGLIKRGKVVNGSNRLPFDQELITEIMHPGKDWIIKIPKGSQQYTFLVGTKIDKGLTWALWSNEGFYPVDGPRGWNILKRLNYKEHKPPFDTDDTKQLEMF